MDADPVSSPSPVPAPRPLAPPTQPGPLRLPPRQPGWPNVLGIVCIVVGVLGILSGLWGAVAPLLVDTFMAAVPPGQTAPVQAVRDMIPWMILSAVFNTVAAAVLLAAGIGLVRRRRWGVTTARGWAVLKMLATVVAVAVGYVVQQAQFEAMRQDPNMPAAAVTIGGKMAPIFILLGLAWGWALPVFVLVWLGRRKIRAETAAW